MIAIMTTPRLRVAIDAHTIGRRATGNETYVLGLMQGLAAKGEVDLVALVDPDAELPPQVAIGCATLRHRHAIPRLLSELSGARRRWGADLLHVQYVRPPLSDVPVVTTIHDISFEHFPDLFTRRTRLRLRATIPWSARRSRVVITGSTYSRQDLIDRYHLSAERVWVTPYAADSRFHRQDPREVDEVLTRLRLPRDYVLCVGNLQPRKNLPRLLDAYERLSHDRPPLVIVGQRAWLHAEVFSTIRRLGLQELVHLTGYVAADDLPALYGGALVFAYPTLFEGFGLPVLEAMACGAPTLSSQSSSIPEVTGDAAILVDPTDVDAIAGGLQRLIRSDELRAALRERGFRQAAQFSWQRCAEATVAAYRSALQ